MQYLFILYSDLTYLDIMKKKSLFKILEHSKSSSCIYFKKKFSWPEKKK